MMYASMKSVAAEVHNERLNTQSYLAYTPRRYLTHFIITEWAKIYRTTTTYGSSIRHFTGGILNGCKKLTSTTNAGFVYGYCFL